MVVDPLDEVVPALRSPKRVNDETSTFGEFGVSGRQSHRMFAVAHGSTVESAAASLKSRDRHSEWRAGHVVQADFVKEVHRIRIATVFSAHTAVQVRSGRSPRRNSDLDEFTDALRSIDSNGETPKTPFSRYAEKKAASTSSRLKPHGSG